MILPSSDLHKHATAADSMAKLQMHCMQKLITQIRTKEKKSCESCIGIMVQAQQPLTFT